MTTIINLILVALVTIYIVDLSGFTDAWRAALARLLHISEAALRPLPPFDCGKCATWWVCIIFLLATGTFSLPLLAFVALLSFLSVPIGQLLLFVREGLNTIISKLLGLL